VARLDNQARCFRCMSQRSGHPVCGHRIHHGGSFSRDQPVRSGDPPCMRQTKDVTDGADRRNRLQQTRKAGKPAQLLSEDLFHRLPLLTPALIVSPVATYPTLMVLGLMGISHTHSMYGGFTPSAYSVVPSTWRGNREIAPDGYFPRTGLIRRQMECPRKQACRRARSVDKPGRRDSIAKLCAHSRHPFPLVSTATTRSSRKVTPWLRTIFRRSRFS
jgi:hypothetical protein